MPPQMVVSATMNEDKFRKALEQAKATFFSGSKPRQKQPHVIIVAGQPGAGKTDVKTSAVKELVARGGSVVIDIDTMRYFVPDYFRFIEQDCGTSVARTDDISVRLSRELRLAAMADKRNLILDETLHEPAAAMDLVKELKSGGYEIDIRAMATPLSVSAALLAQRFEKAVQSGLETPRYYSRPGE